MNKDFCEFLEYHLSKAFAACGYSELQYFWCDGIEEPTDGEIMDDKITTKAWVGKSGQDIYLMTIKLGEQSVECIRKNLSLVSCLPDADLLSWVTINADERIIDINLL